MARHFRGHKIKLCYEASYVGYCLQRDLVSNDIHCDIVSPSSIPSPRGKAIKTDRIDAGYMAQFYANDLLTIVQPPDEEQEQDRDLLRSRQKVMQQRNQLRKQLQAVLRRSGLHYKTETQYKSRWTKHHYFWLARTINGLSGSLKVNLELLLRQLKALNEVLTEYGQQINVLANLPRSQFSKISFAQRTYFSSNVYPRDDKYRAEPRLEPTGLNVTVLASGCGF